MPVTLAKTPRPFLVLVQDGAVLSAIPTPTHHSKYEAVFVEAFTHCLEVREVTATDRYDAHTTVTAAIAREEAISREAERRGYSEDTARTIYIDCRIWAQALSADGRAQWLPGLEQLSPLKHLALAEVMREHGEL